jgi:hypothetical protein
MKMGPNEFKILMWVGGVSVLLLIILELCRASYRRGFKMALQMDDDILAQAGKKASDRGETSEEEPTFGRGLDKALKDGESARIAATDERINRRKS